jgi:hypothetical protein
LGDIKNMLHNISEVCELSDRSRSDIYRMLNDGALSFIVDVDGKRKIESSEILRVFPDVSLSDDDIRPADDHRVLNQQQEIYELRGMITDLKGQIDHVLEDNRRLLRLLEHQTVANGGTMPPPSATELAGQGVEAYRKRRPVVGDDDDMPRASRQSNNNERPIWERIRDFFFSS